MYSKAKIGRHPIHPMFVAFPITFYLTTFVAFLVYQTASNDIFWFKLAYFCNFAGVVTALVAAIPGFIDWAFGIPRDTLAKKDGMIHMTLNLITLGIFATNAIMISGQWETGITGVGMSVVLTACGCITLMFAGFYGWKMVGQHKVGVLMTAEQERIQDRYENEEEPPVVFH
ncbi:DUF2231 domain-containing protein [Bdellovibrio sp. 22V]|uniref:DUF2231 domain-containing protein n=1 Tax=Bdellovibrio TaxID=958 RepID=UPI00254291DE|nr:DUF2231 domain-containing protein [Bdellovibrio sp. 22V]WII73321.1 DUF2231 domain-containing protein [Bdellovibrio sp. 22V]